MLNLINLDDSGKRYSFLVPILVFFVNTVGFWNDIAMVYNSLRIFLKVLEDFFLFFLYSLSISGLYKTITGRAPTEMMWALSSYVFLPLLSVFLDVRVSLLILFFTSLFLFRKLELRNLLFISLVRASALCLFIWKISSWMR
ncbi:MULTISPECIES: hypothetical protein [unclassified Thermotoga]|uniref:hypothetical protein n=1 Tax=unclassified Thermotoga TaxID=2631113 RepID=UPI000280E887|nr:MULTISPECIES: hypothetical protein [unclassified Thermotoga]AIY85737.1 hypothetical protein T2812B_00930 [Thermotoga sp. 2812B]EJX26976.1 hypothetical protein EMP_01847 [Thermotoga sp. EMP]KHC90240.1 hypothetical protein Mc24_07759 [Thermotoga sp. Mc24]